MATIFRSPLITRVPRAISLAAWLTCVSPPNLIRTTFTTVLPPGKAQVSQPARIANNAALQAAQNTDDNSLVTTTLDHLSGSVPLLTRPEPLPIQLPQRDTAALRAFIPRNLNTTTLRILNQYSILADPGAYTVNGQPADIVYFQLPYTQFGRQLI